MKNNEQLFDDFLQQQVEETDLPYKGEYWEKMSMLLDEEEKKKRFPFWRGLSMLLVVAIVGVATFLGIKYTTSNEIAKQPNENKTVSQNEMLPSVHKDQPLTKPYENIATENTNTSSKVDETKSSIPKSNQTQTLIPAASTSIKHNTKNIPTHNQQTNTTNENIIQDGNTDLDATSEFASVQKTNSQKTSAPKSTYESKANKKPMNQATENVIDKSEASIPKRKKTKKQKVFSSTKSEKANTISALEIPSNSKTREQVLVQKEKILAPIDTIRYTARSKRDESIYNPRYNASLANYIPERLDSITLITYKIAEATKASVSQAIPNSTPEKILEKRKFSLICLLGISANKGFKTEMLDPISWGFSPFIGVGFDKPIGQKISLSSHLGFTYFNGLNSSKSVTSYQYGFGLDSSSFQVAHKKLLQLYLPVSLYYQVLKNHALLASIGLSYSSNVSSEVTETSLSNNTGYAGAAAKTPSKNTATQNGYYTGFNQYDVFAQLGYAYTLRHNMTAQIVYQQGFIDATKNSYFSNTITNTQTRITLGIKYHFKRK